MTRARDRQQLFAVAVELLSSAHTRATVLDEEVRPEPDYESFWLLSASGHRTGLLILLTLAWQDQVASMADQLQDFVVEELAMTGSSPVWPECAVHPQSHPLKAAVDGGRAVWVCPRTNQEVVPILRSVS
jgi:hypothetical protein